MGRRPKEVPLLTVDQIIDETIACIDEHGLEAFTMRRLAARMGVYSSAIYWHVSSKARLLALASTRLVDKLPADDEGTDWRVWLVQAARQVRSTMHEHANFAPVFGSQLSVDVGAAAPFIEAVLTVLRRTGLDESRVVDAFNAYIGLVLGWVSMELSTQPEGAHGEEAPGHSVQDQLRALRAEEQPNLVELIPRLSNHAFMMRWDPGRTNPLDSSFDFVIETFIAGLERRVPGG